MLMIVLGNSLTTLLFEKLVISRCLSPITQLRKELIRIKTIESEMDKSRDEMYKVNNRFSVPRRMIGERQLTVAAIRQVKRKKSSNHQPSDLE